MWLGIHGHVFPINGLILVSSTKIDDDYYYNNSQHNERNNHPCYNGGRVVLVGGEYDKAFVLVIIILIKGTLKYSILGIIVKLSV